MFKYSLFLVDNTVMFKVDKMPKQWTGNGTLYVDKETGYSISSNCDVAIDRRFIYLLGNESKEVKLITIDYGTGISSAVRAKEDYIKIKTALENFSKLYEEKGVLLPK